MELNNNAEMVQEVAEMATATRFDKKTVAEVVIGAVLIGGITYGAKKLWDKKLAPKFRKNKKEEKTEE